MSLPASIRINVRAPFPARVQGASFITVTKANGVWTVAPDYTKLAPSPGVQSSQILALYDTVSKTWSYVSALSFSTPSVIYREIPYTGNVTVLVTDSTLVMAKTSSGSTSILLPISASRGGASLTVKDLTGDANTNNITFVPASGETIDGFSGSAAAANGVAVIDIDYGSKTLYPLVSGGWYAK